MSFFVLAQPRAAFILFTAVATNKHCPSARSYNNEVSVNLFFFKLFYVEHLLRFCLNHSLPQAVQEPRYPNCDLNVSGNVCCTLKPSPGAKISSRPIISAN